MNAYWLSWYHEARYGEFELHSPWWISGFRFEPEADTIVAAVQAESEEAAWEIVLNSYDVRPGGAVEQRFCSELGDREPWSERFPRADWMQWSTGGA